MRVYPWFLATSRLEALPKSRSDQLARQYAESQPRMFEAWGRCETSQRLASATEGADDADSSAISAEAGEALNALVSAHKEAEKAGQELVAYAKARAASNE